MKIIISIVTFCLLCTTSLSSKQKNEIDPDELLSTSILRYEMPDRVCTKPGLMCKNCEELVNCILGEYNEYEQVLVQTCSVEETCLKNHCTKNLNPLCIRGYEFQCTGVGVFPDPFNCQKFHYCVVESKNTYIKIIEGQIGKITMMCDEGYGFDPVSLCCKTNLTASGCPDDKYPVPICTESGQSGALINKSIYYTCIVNNDMLIPMLYYCPHGKTYSKNRCS